MSKKTCKYNKSWSGFDLAISIEKTFEHSNSYLYEEENDKGIKTYNLYTLEDVRIINIPELLFKTMFVSQEEIRKAKIKKLLT